MLTILQGDALTQLRTLPSESAHCCVTSPPYWGLRDYSTPGQLGLEKTPGEYVAKMVEVFREVRRVLRKDGTLWLNLGDSYYNYRPGGDGLNRHGLQKNTQSLPESTLRRGSKQEGLKEKDLCGIPWRVAFALQADGWWLRSDIIWAKPNPMPESVTDRPTKAHEYLFLFAKNSSYFYDAGAIKERGQGWNGSSFNSDQDFATKPNLGTAVRIETTNRNKRSVWTVATAPYPEAHFATYPSDLIKPCIMAGTSAKGCCAKCGSPWERVVERTSMGIMGGHSHVPMESRGTFRDRQGDSQFNREGLTQSTSKTIGWQPACKCAEPGSSIPATVLDPFAGSGTTGAVALELGRKAILIELNPKYVKLIRKRCDVTPGLQLA